MSDTTERCEDCGHPLEEECDCSCCGLTAWLLDHVQLCPVCWDDPGVRAVLDGIQ